MAVAAVGKGTVSMVLPVITVARAWAIKVPPRTKFTTGRSKPRFAKPVPVTVKLAGGAARSTVPGAMLATPGTAPVTARWRLPPLDVKLTFAEKTPEVVGLNRTVTICVAPTVRLKEPPERMRKGGAAETVPVSVPPPVFWTTKFRSAVLPTLTVPKFRESGVTDRLGGTGVPPIWIALIHVPQFVSPLAYSWMCQIVRLSWGSSAVEA